VIVVGVPSGTVTFLFTDIEGSTRLWDQHREAMRAIGAQVHRKRRLGVRRSASDMRFLLPSGQMMCSLPVGLLPTR
jgi:hypothetical protein